MKSRKLLLVLVLLIVVLGGAFAWWAFAPDRLDRGWDEVRHGMTEAETQAILGEPDIVNQDPKDGTTAKKWISDRTMVMVFFDANGRVIDKGHHRRPLWDRVRKAMPW